MNSIACQFPKDTGQSTMKTPALLRCQTRWNKFSMNIQKDSHRSRLWGKYSIITTLDMSIWLFLSITEILSSNACLFKLYWSVPLMKQRWRTQEVESHQNSWVINCRYLKTSSSRKCPFGCIRESSRKLDWLDKEVWVSVSGKWPHLSKTQRV